MYRPAACHHTIAGLVLGEDNELILLASVEQRGQADRFDHQVPGFFDLARHADQETPDAVGRIEDDSLVARLALPRTQVNVTQFGSLAPVDRNGRHLQSVPQLPHFHFALHAWLLWKGRPSRPGPDYAAFPFTGFAGVFGAAPTRLPAAPSLASRRLHWHLKQSFLPSYLSFEFSMILVTVNGFRTPSPLTSISTPVIFLPQSWQSFFGLAHSGSCGPGSVDRKSVV